MKTRILLSIGLLFVICNSHTWAASECKVLGPLYDGSYSGGCKDGLAHGNGTQTFSNGFEYVGDFVNGNREGKGALTGPNGYKYVGGYINGKRQGKGTETTQSGDKYEGDWVDGKRHGKGTLTLANGTTQSGDFLDGKFVASTTSASDKNANASASGSVKKQAEAARQPAATINNGTKKEAAATTPKVPVAAQIATTTPSSVAHKSSKFTVALLCKHVPSGIPTFIGIYDNNTADIVMHEMHGLWETGSMIGSKVTKTDFSINFSHHYYDKFSLDRNTLKLSNVLINQNPSGKGNYELWSEYDCSRVSDEVVEGAIKDLRAAIRERQRIEGDKKDRQLNSRKL